MSPRDQNSQSGVRAESRISVAGKAAVQSIALILLTAFLIVLYWARIYAIGRIGEFILARLRPAAGRASAFVLGLFVYYLLAIIPFIGWFVVPLVMLFGLGAELIARKRVYTTARAQDLI